ncbi:MAG: DUF4062 domain-containing protein [Saprospiraceae bacterium]|nr:DUF4062 domain-containing protein [Saprospiraceae bacterium]
MSIIKTPDQRIRVFISSTINELASERKAAREAISNLRLTPVFFEAGARPHPPRDLYSAYLQQSHIFLGIYWNSYGWIAPGADISGLEDEYRLCGYKPKLIYVKDSSTRDEKLNLLLSDLQDSETACYQRFSTSEELQILIENDLSVLLSETFENALHDLNSKNHSPTNTDDFKSFRVIDLPNIKSKMFGREEDIQKLLNLILKPEVSLVNILGAGGTGKTTLCINIAHELKENFINGAIFVPLAPVTDFKLVCNTIAESLGIQDSGKSSIEQTLIDFLRDKNILLLLDNFEQVVDASKFISDIIINCPQIKILITSRTSLHIRNEYIYHLKPLHLPEESKSVSTEDLKKYPSTELFLERALSVNPAMPVNEENTKAIINICQRLDGLPLAIELAAARTKFFQPAALVARIQNSLDIVSKGQKDLPERQQTLRSAIEWSYNLLETDTQKVFRQLGIFKRSWTIESADVISQNENNFINIEEMMERLLDVSLIKPVLVNHSSESRFNMLQTVHEYAYEKLKSSPEYSNTSKKYANYFLQLLEQSEGLCWGIHSEPWFDKIEYEFQNIRAAFYYFVFEKQYEEAWKFIYLLTPFWNIRSGFNETLNWIKEAKLDVYDPNHPDLANIDLIVKVKTFIWAGYCLLYMVKIEEGMGILKHAKNYADQLGDPDLICLSLSMYGCYSFYLGIEDASEYIVRAKPLADQTRDPFVKCVYYVWNFEYLKQNSDVETIKNYSKMIYTLGKIEEIPILLGYYLITQGFERIEDINLDDRLRLCKEIYQSFPEKGYKGFKSATMLGCGEVEFIAKNYQSAEIYLYKGIEYARESGDMESKLWGVIISCVLFSDTDQTENAFKLLGSLENFIDQTGYPISGKGLSLFEQIKNKLYPDTAIIGENQWYEHGKKMSLDDSLIYISKQFN